jgi:DNA modification methylase
MVAVFREVRRVLRRDGTLWLNLGDSYASSAAGNSDETFSAKQASNRGNGLRRERSTVSPGLKPKDLVGIPWRVAFALQADGWYLRSDIIWAKPNPMPESVTDRPTKAHEYLFLLSKAPRYYYDADAVREGVSGGAHPQGRGYGVKAVEPGQGIKNNHSFSGAIHNATQADLPTARNLRSVWNIATEPYPGAHFATFPRKLVEPCIKAGTGERGVCPECEAPWVRVVERQDTGVRQKKADGWATHEGGHGSFHRDGREAGDGGQPVLATITTGWRPTCSHYPRTDEWPALPARQPGESIDDYDARIEPETTMRAMLLRSWEPLRSDRPIVLDPFAGSGTTLLVAQALGRRGVGIDLNPEYLRQALDRNRQAPLGLVG